MKTKLLSLAIAAAIPFTAMAQNTSNNTALSNNLLSDAYVSVGGGIAKTHNKIKHLVPISHDTEYRSVKLKKNPVYKISIGKSINNFRSEIEFIHSKKNKLTYNDGSFKSHLNISSNSYLINGYYDFKDFNEKVTPYIGLGLGISQNKISDEVWYTLTSSSANAEVKIPSKKKNSFAWNIGTGMMLNINKHVSLDLSYRYMDLGKLKGSDKQIDLSTGNIEKDSYNIKGKLRSNIFLASIVVKF